MRGGWLGIVIVGLVLAPWAAAQAPTEAVSESMALTDQAPVEVEAPSTAVCGTHAVHGFAEPGEAPEMEAKAYTSQSSVAVGCPTLFRAPTPGAFNLTSEVTVHLFIGCDEPTLMHEPLNNLRVWLTRNGQDVSEALTSVGPMCSPDAPMEAEVAIEAPDDPGFAAGNMMGLNVTPFGSPNAAVENLHVLVGGNETASTVTLPGLSKALEVPEEAPVEEINGSDTANNDTELEPQTTTDDGNGIPGPGVPGSMLALGLVVLARRRP